MNEIKTPLLILAAAPKEKIQLPDSFFEKGSVFFNLLQNPSYLRYSGWNLRTLDTPRLKDGEYWEVRNGDAKLLRIYSDGSFVATASVAQDFLGWRQEKDPPQLHALAVIEFVYEFAQFYKIFLQNILELGIKVGACRFKIGIKELPSAYEKLILRPYEIGKWEFMIDALGEKYEIEADFTKEIENQEVTDSIYDPRYVAYRLVGILFRQFGVPIDAVPYTKTDAAQKRFVDIERIKPL
jgi:hypothetical protein